MSVVDTIKTIRSKNAVASRLLLSTLHTRHFYFSPSIILRKPEPPQNSPHPMKSTASSLLVRTGSPALFLLGSAIAALLSLHSARAATQFAAGSFVWDDGITPAWASGSGGAYDTVWTSGNDAILEGTAGTASIAATGATVQTITFNTTDYLIQGNTLTLNGTTPTITLGTGISASIQSVIAGNVGLTKAGAGTLTLSGANTYDGGTTLAAGTLRIGAGNTGDVGAITSSPIGTGTLTLNGGKLSSDSATARTILNPVAVTGNVFFGDGTNFGTLSFNAAGNLGSSRTLTVATGTTAEFNAIMSGSGITFNGPGTLVLTKANTFAGNFTMNGTGTGTSPGVVRITRADVFGSATLSWNGNPRTVLELDGTGGNINFSKNFGNTSGYILRNVAGTNTVTSGMNMFTGAGGTRVVSDGGVLTLSGAIQAGQGARTLELSGSSTGANTASGLISPGNGTSLLKSGTGTWILTNANTYGLTTSVSGGTLLVNNTSGSGTGTSAISVTSAGTLGGRGTISGTVSVAAGGTIRLGASNSTLSLSNATAPAFAAYSTLRILASANTLDKVALTNSTPSFTCDNLDLVIDTTGLTGNVSGATIVSAAKGSGGISGTFHSVTVTGNTAYTPTVQYNASLGTITLDLTTSAGPFATWATSTHGLSGDAATANADPDLDSLANAIEFVLGGKPNPANPDSNSVSLLPQVTVSAGKMLFTYRRTALSLTEPGISITTEYGSDLTNWATAQNGTLGVTINTSTDFYGTGIDKVEVAIPQSLATGAKLFARLRVSMP
jgi:autotransporter-associated beta strand protein